MKFLGLGTAFAVLACASTALAQQPYPDYPPQQQQQQPQGQYGYPPPHPAQYQYQQYPQNRGYPQPPAYDRGAPEGQGFAPPPTPAQFAPPAPPQYGDNQNGFQNTGRRLSLTDKLAQKAQNGLHDATTVVNIAVGDADNANAKQAFPAINRVAGGSLTLHADPSTGSYESATGVCLGIDAAAVVQLDAVLVRVHSPLEEQYQSNDSRAPTDCGGEISTNFTSLFPQIGYLIVSSDSGYSSMHSLLYESGRPKIIAVGVDGSGGAITFKSLLKSSDNRWHATTQRVAGTDALQALENHQIDGYFVMEAPNSHFINDIVKQFDGGGKFKFIAINPYDKFFAMHDGRGLKVYQEMNLPGGHWYSGSTASISVDTVLITNARFEQGNRAAVRALHNAAQRAVPEIRSQTGTPDNWTPASHL